MPEAVQARAIAVRRRSCVTPGKTGRSGARSSRGGSVASDGVEEVGRERDPAAASALLDGAADAPAGVRLVEVAAAQALLLELADAHAGRVEDEHGERVAARHER